MMNLDYLRDPAAADDFAAFLDAFTRHIAPVAAARGIPPATAVILFAVASLGQSAEALTDATEAMLAARADADDPDADAPWRKG